MLSGPFAWLGPDFSGHIEIYEPVPIDPKRYSENFLNFTHDFNGDGWPDLWVGNHNYKPSLYINQRKGSFVDIIDRVWDADPKADTHGASWADFDNDGDQDLIELVGVILTEYTAG